MKQSKLIVLLLLFLLIGSGCKKDEEVHEIKLVSDQEGCMVFISVLDKWAIQVIELGTFDMVDYYLIKSVDKNYLQQGMNVVFSGNVYLVDDIKNDIGGTAYYYIELINIKQK